MAKQILEIGTGENRVVIKRIGNHNRAVIWVGPPLAGKDTQTDRFAELGIPVLQMGPVLRALAEQEPNGHVHAALSKKEFLDDPTVLWRAKLWVISRLGEPMIHLNGIPRTVPQLEIIKFLEEHGFDPMVVWFDLPNEVCLNRPCRLGRETEDTSENRVKRLLIYKEKTLPMLNELHERFRITQDNGNLLMIDNSIKEKHETAQEILKFLHLPITVKHLFPEVFLGNGGLETATS